MGTRVVYISKSKSGYNLVVKLFKEHINDPIYQIKAHTRLYSRQRTSLAWLFDKSVAFGWSWNIDTR